MGAPPPVTSTPTPLTERLAGKVVFARETIAPETSSTAGFVDAIELGQPLHGRAYFTTSVGERAANAGEDCNLAQYSVAVRPKGSDWRTVDSFTVSSKDNVDAWTSVRVTSTDHGSLMPSEALQFPSDRGSVQFSFTMVVASSLEVGPNPVDFRVQQACLTKKSLTEEALGTVEIRVASAEALAAWHQATGPTLDSAPHPEAAALMANVRRIWQGTDEILDLSVLRSSWSIERHPATGLPLRREVPLAFVLREDDRCVARVGFFISEYDGNAYAPPALFWSGENSRKSSYPCGSGSGSPDAAAPDPSQDTAQTGGPSGAL